MSSGNLPSSSELVVKTLDAPLDDARQTSTIRGRGLLDEILLGFANSTSSVERAKSSSSKESTHRADLGLLDRFLSSKSVAEQLELCFGRETLNREAGKSWTHFALRLQQAVAKIDQLVTDQLLAILHHPDFQRLEASWRGVEYLVRIQDQEAGDTPIKIRVLNATYAELFRDFDRAIEFDQSQLFKKVYEEELGTPGGEPFGVLLADYDIHPRLIPGVHRFNDMDMLTNYFSQVAAASFCPIILNASPTMFGLNRFDEMQATIDYSKTHDDLTFLKWKEFREKDDSRFVALAMPRMLLRHRYQDSMDKHRDFPFVELISDRDQCLWGGAAFAMGEVLIRSFANNKWLADIRGAQRNRDGGGIVKGIGSEDFTTDSRGVVEKPIVDLQIGDFLERHLVELGFLPLSACKDIGAAAFYSCPSTQLPKRYNDPASNANARISSMLNYMLCVSRFAHYIKVIGRDKVGLFQDAYTLQKTLEDWITGYVTPDADASENTKAEYPLRDASVQVVPSPGKPGSFDCIFQLSPHYELEDMQASIKLRTELVRRS